MAHDIFSDYINKQRKKIPELNENNVSANERDKHDDTISILKEISSKLDVFNRTQDYIENISNELTGSKSSSAAYAADIGLPADSYADIAIENGKVVIPGCGVIDTNVYIKDGRIYSLGVNPYIKAKKRIDARNKYVVPGIIDPHVHLGLFASLTDELISETKAALVGGITTIGCHIGSKESHMRSFPGIAEKINNYSHVDIVPHFVITTDEQRREIKSYIDKFGVTSFKVYMNGIPGLIPDVDDGFILDVLSEIKKSDKKSILCCHAENRDIIRRAYNYVKEEKGDNATIQDWSDTHPDIAEEEAVMRLSFLAEKSEVPVYFVHISSKNAVKRLQEIKRTNKYINIETTSPYLSLTRNVTAKNNIKMEPPFREQEDVEELWKAVFEGVVDTIGTDNVTMTMSEKKINDTIWNTIPGYPALETHLPVLLNEGVVKRGIPLDLLIGKLTRTPAEIFGIYPQKGTILPGSDADVVIIDMDMSKEVKASERSTRSDFSLYEGEKIQGWPVLTIKNGELAAENGEYLGNHPGGKYIKR